MSQPKNEMIYARLSGDMKEEFYAKCGRLSKEPSAMIREMIEAFNDGRLRIVPDETYKEEKEELYDVN